MLKTLIDVTFLHVYILERNSFFRIYEEIESLWSPNSLNTLSTERKGNVLRILKDFTRKEKTPLE